MGEAGRVKDNRPQRRIGDPIQLQSTDLSGSRVYTSELPSKSMIGAKELKEARTQTARSIALAMLIVIMDM